MNKMDKLLANKPIKALIHFRRAVIQFGYCNLSDIHFDQIVDGWSEKCIYSRKRRLQKYPIATYSLVEFQLNK